MFPPGRLEGRFNRKTRTKGVTYTIGKNPKDGKWLPALVIFDRSKFDKKEAGKWWKENKSKYGFKFYDEYEKGTVV